MKESIEQVPQSTQQTQEQSPVLSYEAFTHLDEGGRPHYNNFYCPFLSEDKLFTNILRNRPFMQRFMQEQPELFENLCTKVQSTIKENIDTMKRECNPDLYVAYKILHGYGVSDDELFV